MTDKKYKLHKKGQYFSAKIYGFALSLQLTVSSIKFTDYFTNHTRFKISYKTSIHFQDSSRSIFIESCMNWFLYDSCMI